MDGSARTLDLGQPTTTTNGVTDRGTARLKVRLSDSVALDLSLQYEST